MGISVYVKDEKGGRVEEFHISHNYRNMAIAAGIYELLWQKTGFTGEHAEPLLRAALISMHKDAQDYRKLAVSYWDDLDDFIKFIKEIHYICMINPEYVLECV